MFKLIKYEFLKMRTLLGLMTLALIALEIGFIAGDKTQNPELMGVCLGLLSVLAFAVYLVILLSGISSYGKELNDKTGYMTFMAPVTPLGVVASKLLFTMAAAVVMAALFGGAVYYDMTRLFDGVEWDPQMLEQMNFFFRVYLGGQYGLTTVLLNVALIGVTVVLQVLAVMCAAYLAITLAATLLQNKKGFLRFLVSIIFFGVLQYVMSTVSRLVIGSPAAQTTREAMSYIAKDLALEGAFCVLFAGVSAWLLDRKVSL